MMWQHDRLQRIVDLLTSHGQVSTAQMVRELGVSRETVRRDFQELELAGKLRRVHGGAALANTEPPFLVRASSHIRSKRAVAQLAARQIPAGASVFVDAGATTPILAEELARCIGVTIVTNSLEVATRISEGNGSRDSPCRVILLGGEVQSNPTGSYGESVIREIMRLHADVALLTPSAIDSRYGAMTFRYHEADVARAMVDNADTVIIAADYSKVGVCGRASYCAVERIDCLVTNRKAHNSETIKELERQSVKLLFAGPSSKGDHDGGG